MLYYIINGKLTKDIVNNTFEPFMKYNKIDTTIKNKRICKTPFKKWYIKGYVNKSDYTKIIDFILGFSIKINYNLKTLSKSITIIGIDFIE